MNLQNLKTKSGKTIQDFTIPEALLQDHELVTLIMQSESMTDEERQYWFNLTEVMTPQQIEKLRSILLREKKKLAEIDAKYGKAPKEDPAVVAQRAKAQAQKRHQERSLIQQKETAHEEAEKEAEEAALAELENL